VAEIKVELNAKSINRAVKEVERYKLWVLKKETELRSRLAMLGATVASIQFARAIYTGSNDVTVRVDDTGSVAVIYAEGEAVAFIEFGAGATYGYGHPLAGQFGTGPGTYPDGKGHWDNPKGWWFGNSQHTYGNPPAAAMYTAVQEITENVTRIAREVFRST
jgi:hypothetical protein